MRLLRRPLDVSAERGPFTDDRNSRGLFGGAAQMVVKSNLERVMVKVKTGREICVDAYEAQE
jgi:hypothetical protein